MNGYKSFFELYDDYRKIVEIYLGEYLSFHKRLVHTDSPLDKYKGIVVSLEEAESFSRSERFRIGTDTQVKLNALRCEIDKKIKNTDIFLPSEYTTNVFNMDFFGKLLMMCSYFSCVDSTFGKACGYINDDVSKHSLTLGTACKIFFGSNLSKMFELQNGSFPMIFDYKHDCPDMSMTELKLNKRIFDLLTGDYIIKELPYVKAVSLIDEPHDIVGRDKELSAVKLILKNCPDTTIGLCGAKGQGKRFLACHACRAYKKNILYVDWGMLQNRERSEYFNELMRELYLQNAVCCVYNIAENSSTSRLSSFINAAAKLKRRLIICAENRISLEIDHPIEYIKLENLNTHAASRLWRMGGIELADDVNTDELAAKYRFLPSQIFDILNSCETYCRINSCDKLTEGIIERICIEASDNIFDGKAVRVRSNFTLKDLILPEDEKRQIEEGMAHIRYKHIVYDRWGFGETLSYGRGLSMLFDGPPGTGKTMAASIIGNELGLPVFKIDLSRMVSKYIGETEKNLGEVFDIAQNSSAVLFFDETDALFGKRMEVRDSNDKYANIEAAYLLQRMEDYDGIIVMATNLLQNIDEAFLRRISYIIHFPFPDCEQRLLLWRSVFPNGAALSEDIDFTFLAQSFEMSGAMIKNTAVSAAFLAAAESGKITMREILRAIVKQLSKFGKTVGADAFGPYAFYFDK